MQPGRIAQTCKIFFQTSFLFVCISTLAALLMIALRLMVSKIERHRDLCFFWSSKPGNRDFQQLAPQNRQKVAVQFVSLNNIFKNPLKWNQSFRAKTNLQFFEKNIFAKNWVFSSFRRYSGFSRFPLFFRPKSIYTRKMYCSPMKYLSKSV